MSRLEERIRYVAAGRERLVRQRAELEAQSAAWRSRESDAGAEHARLGGEIEAAERAAESLAGELATHASRVAELEGTLREAQSRSSAQRGAVATVQQQIQVSAAEARGVDERLTQAEARRERLRRRGEGPGRDRARRARSRASAPRAEAEAKHHAALADARRLAGARAGARRGAQVAAGPRQRGRSPPRRAERAPAALQALQEKVQVENKLKPWLSRHGLESLAGLWTRVRIEPGWEAALEAALRERLGALEIGRLDTVRAFAADAPPSRLAFFTAPNAAHPTSHQTLPRLADLLHLGDAGLSALLGDWLEGVYTASDFDDALAARSRLTHGEVIMTREGHAVSQFAVSFYAPDSEQAGLLARAQEIENLERQTRAQALVSEESRSRLVRAEAASTDAAAHLAASQRDAAQLQSVAHRAAPRAASA